MLDDILNLLKTDFGLKKNHILILEAVKTDSKAAEDISKTTGIPLGRIYGFLRDLEKEKLIDKGTEYPAKYSFSNPKKKVKSFVGLRFRAFMNTEAKMASFLSQIESEEKTNIINDSLEYTLFLNEQLAIKEDIKILVRSNSIIPDFYPFERDELIKVRKAMEKVRNLGGRATFSSGEATIQLFQRFQEYVKSGKKMEYLITKEGADLFFSILQKKFGKKYAKEQVKRILQQLNVYKNSKIYVSKDFVAYNIYLTHDIVGIFLSSTEGFIVGFASNNKAIRDFYLKLYESNRKRSVPIEGYLKQKLQELRM